MKKQPLKSMGQLLYSFTIYVPRDGEVGEDSENKAIQEAKERGYTLQDASSTWHQGERVTALSFIFND